MTDLDELENKSIYIIREAYARHRNMAMLWSIGKDSTALLWLVRKAFFGPPPFPVVHIDTGRKFKEIYEFRDRFAAEWNLNLLIARSDRALEAAPSFADKLACCTELKTNALKRMIAERRFAALLLAIRRDEHGIRAKERFFSPRDRSFQWNYLDQPAELWDQYGGTADSDTHLRIHPMLDWRELDIWRYIQREGIPVVSLYFARNGRRFRSIGCECCCQPVESNAATLDEIVEELRTTRIAERAGRAQDKEQAFMMQKLRSLGYM
ncbi:MAG: sulfate adenylyltransferase subunit CysD [Candidatus Sumerlaeia bacterium]|nr:sulfate adenylyltransferase subunit CysD [Candidatus Sumerlaeia bacterium]